MTRKPNPITARRALHCQPTGPSQRSVRVGVALAIALAVAVGAAGHTTSWSAPMLPVAETGGRVLAHDGPATAIACGMDGLVLSGGADRVVRAWYMDGRNAEPIAHLSGTTATITDIAMAPTGRWAVAAQIGGGLVFWRLDDLEPLRVAAAAKGAERHRPQEPALSGLPVIEPALILADSQTTWRCATPLNGRWLATGSADGGVRVWRARARRHIATTTDGADPRRKTEHDASSAHVGDAFVGYDLIVSLVVERRVHDGAVRALAFSRDGRLLATAGQDESLQLHRLDVLAVGGLSSEDADELEATTPVADLQFIESRGGNRDTIASLAFMPDGSGVSAAGWDGTLHSYRIVDSSGEKRLAHVNSRRVVAGHALWTTAISTDASFNATAGETGRIRIDRHLDAEVTTIQHGDLVWDLAFAPDAPVLVSASVDGTLLQARLPLAYPGRVVVAGANVLGDLASMPFVELQPDRQIRDALRGMLDLDVDVLISTRALEQADLYGRLEARLIELPTGLGALAVIANAQNQWLESITIDELGTLMSSTDALKWRDLRAEWPNRRVQIVFSSNSPLRSVADAIVPEGKSLQTARAYDLSTERKVVDTVDQMLLDSIGLVTVGSAAGRSDGVRVVPIDFGDGPVAPTDEAVADGAYPGLTFPVFAYVNLSTSMKPEVAALVDGLLAGEGESAGANEGDADDEPADAAGVQLGGITPLPEAVRRAVRGHFRHRLTGMRYAMTPDLETAYADPADFVD